MINATLPMFFQYRFAFAGIMAYVAADAAFNPMHQEGKRTQAITSKIYPELTGCHSMWGLGVSSQACAAIFNRPVPHGTLPGLIPPIIAFTTVKGTNTQTIYCNPACVTHSI